MKKAISIILCIVVVASLAAVSFADTVPAVKIYINNELQTFHDDTQPRLVDGRVLISSQVYDGKLSAEYVRVWLPIRDIAEATGAKVTWVDAEKAVYIKTKTIQEVTQ